jgi:hypothetical protein
MARSVITKTFTAASGGRHAASAIAETNYLQENTGLTGIFQAVFQQFACFGRRSRDSLAKKNPARDVWCPGGI